MKNLNEIGFFNSETCVHNIGRRSVCLMKWIAFFDRCFEKLNFLDLMGFVLSALNEESE